jgi:hypothetical protein
MYLKTHTFFAMTILSTERELSRCSKKKRYTIVRLQHHHNLYPVFTCSKPQIRVGTYKSFLRPNDFQNLKWRFYGHPFSKRHSSSLSDIAGFTAMNILLPLFLQAYEYLQLLSLYKLTLTPVRMPTGFLH